MTNPQARFITFEGGDGAGKTTLIQKIYHYLEKAGYPVMHTRAPGGTEIGAQIRRLLLSQHPHPISSRCELFLFLADRAQHVDEVIWPALKNKQIVLCDRFNDSTLAYQGVRGFDTQWLHQLLLFASGNLTPDLTIYLDLDPQVGFDRTQKERSEKDRIESEDIHFHRKIQNAFRQIADLEPHRFVLIDASLSPEIVYEQAKKRIDGLLTSIRK